MKTEDNIEQVRQDVTTEDIEAWYEESRKRLIPARPTYWLFEKQRKQRMRALAAGWKALAKEYCAIAEAQHVEISRLRRERPVEKSTYVNPLAGQCTHPHEDQIVGSLHPHVGRVGCCRCDTWLTDEEAAK